MAIESKIRELLAKASEVETALSEEVVNTAETIEEGAANRPLDKAQGDTSAPLQGDSNANPEMQDLSGSANKEGGLTSEVGKAASSKATKDSTLPAGNGAGEAPNYDSKEDPKNVVAQASSKGNVHQEESEEEGEVVTEVEETEGEVVTEVDETEEETIEEDVLVDSSDIDVEALFADEEGLTEEFKTKAASLFEAVVVAKVNSVVEGIENTLREENEKAQVEFKDEMVEKIDGYLNYVAENWMKENELAIEKGLRTEVTEDFINGMRTLFAEHYIDVPTEKYDIIGEMTTEIDELKVKLDESIEEKMSLVEEKVVLQMAEVISEASQDLTMTDAEKLGKLLESVEFGNKELYAEKVAVIKENYFPKAKVSEDDKMSDTVEGSFADSSSPMSIYSQAITNAVKK
tara:strand:+ start:329 stop:1540 length:1212 start_codon:yes stop_codon:yes gene_type:complete